ncbi:MAG: class F sortase [bacterium]|nr:class F sortase [bacterium]
MGVPKRYWRVGIPLAVIAMLIGAVSAVTLIRLRSTNTVQENSQLVTPEKVEIVAEIVKPGLPVQLMIPKISVDASIVGLGLTPEGDLDTPDGPEKSGWYNAGPRPGAIGSAVIDGHFGWKDNKSAVFDKLHTLLKGDMIYVKDENKVTHTFIVSGLRSFQPDEDATTVFLSNDNNSHLNLITCQGTWNQNQDSYSTRLVVFADILVK